MLGSSKVNDMGSAGSDKNIFVDPVAPKPWTSLFSSLPKNAGVYTPRKFDIKCVNGVNIPPLEVIEAGTLFWKDQLVGFFLYKSPSFSTVNYHVKRAWKLNGSITMRFDNELFFFQFSCPEDRRRILESNPLII